MKIYDEILTNMVLKQCLQDSVESQSIKALEKIRAILANDSLSDHDCFMKIEGIVRVLGDFGIVI